MQLHVGIHGIACAKVDRALLSLIVVLWFALVVVAVILKLQLQGFPRCLVGDAAEDADWSLEHSFAIEVSCALDAGSLFKSITDQPQGI